MMAIKRAFAAVALVAAVAVSAEVPSVQADQTVVAYASPAAAGTGDCLSKANACELSTALALGGNANVTVLNVNVMEGNYTGPFGLPDFLDGPRKNSPGTVQVTLAAENPSKEPVFTSAAAGEPCMRYEETAGSQSTGKAAYTLRNLRFEGCMGAAVEVGNPSAADPTALLPAALVLDGVTIEGAATTAIHVFAVTGDLVVTGSTITGTHPGANTPGNGGAIYTNGPVTVRNSVLSHNKASAGAGVFYEQTRLGVIDADIVLDSVNCTDNVGGCLAVQAFDGSLPRPVTVTVSNSVIARNAITAHEAAAADFRAAPGHLLVEVNATAVHDNTGGAGLLFKGVFVPTNATASNTTWAAVVTHSHVYNNTAASGSSAGVAILTSSVGLPGTTVEENTLSTLVGNLTALDEMSGQIACDRASTDMGSCAHCPLTHRRAFVIKGGHAKCDTCFDQHKLAHEPFADGKSRGPYGCVRFTGPAPAPGKKGTSYAGCGSSRGDGLETCPVLGEDLSFGVADIVGLSALGMATLAIISCVLTTRSADHYTKEREAREQRDGTARLLANQASEPIAAGRASQYGGADDQGTVQSI